ncbi:APC family permease [Brevibacillus choshinensis]|uniref:APC family permease n=1 Tax=Brevibacillus choshinensis TaxID=54911 RepID=UPI002E1CA9B6|nr:APC family permease [Brevibacillus choshinensis]
MKTEQHKALASGVLGVPQLIFLVISAVGPITTLFGNLILILQFGNGIGEPGIYILAMVVWLLFSVGFTAMARHIRNTGAFYAYISQGIARPLGVSASYLSLLSYITIQVALYGLFGYAANVLLTSYADVHLAWWIYSLVSWAFVSFFGYRSIEIGSKILGFLMLGEVAIIVLFSIAALLVPAPEGFTTAPFQPDVVFSGTVGIALLFAFGSFVGFEATAVFSEEAKNPRRTVPIATYWSVIIIGILNAVAAYALIVGWGENGIISRLNQVFSQNGDPGTVVNELATRVLGGWAVLAMQMLLVTSAFAALLAIQNMITRYYFAGARTGILPAKLGGVHPSFRSPHVASIVQSVTSFFFLALAALVGADPFVHLYGWFGAIGTLALLILYSLTSIAVIVYFSRTKVDTRLWHTKIAPGIASICLSGTTIYAILNFSLFVGEGQTALSVVIFGIIACISVAGIVVGLRIKKRLPVLYKAIGVTILDTEQENIEIFDSTVTRKREGA